MGQVYYITSANREIPDLWVKIIFLGEIKFAIRLGIKPPVGDVDLEPVNLLQAYSLFFSRDY